MCCSSEESYMFPLEEMITDLLSTLLIRNLSEEQMKVKIKSIFSKTDESQNIIEKLRETFIDTNPKSNPNIDFHNKFFNKFIEKCETLNIKNIMILAYPLLDNKKNLMTDNLFMLLKEKFAQGLDFEQVSKTLYWLIEFYTYDLTELLEDALEKENEKQIVRDILEKAYSKRNIKNFVYYAMEKDKLENSGLWKTVVSYEKFNPILKTLGLNDYSVIRTNLIFFER